MEELRCQHCRGAIGVYEPVVVVLTDGRVVEGSRLTLRAEIGQDGSVVFHAACYQHET